MIYAEHEFDSAQKNICIYIYIYIKAYPWGVLVAFTIQGLVGADCNQVLLKICVLRGLLPPFPSTPAVPFLN